MTCFVMLQEWKAATMTTNAKSQLRQNRNHAKAMKLLEQMTIFVQNVNWGALTSRTIVY